ncbi:MAG: thioredoxin domain-containing protein, partial [Planctomycetia bacterium]
MPTVPRSVRLGASAAVSLGVFFGSAAADAPPRNRLGDETSPYLRLHAGNPVHWYAWGPEALAAAAAAGKPVFLSIGYSSCHWCHVMNRESFADPEIAALLNEQFICIKVDREERPDVDAAYMNAVQALNDGNGGWPLSAFLLPDGRPFLGGTYFPPADRVDPEGKTVMIGFPTVLKRVADAYKTRRPDIDKQAEAVTEYLRRTSSRPSLAATPATKELIPAATAALLDRVDPEHHGFAGPPSFAPKFPQPTIGLFLLATADGKGVAATAAQASAMRRGGLYDQIGGGFHRYSV